MESEYTNPTELLGLNREMDTELLGISMRSTPAGDRPFNVTPAMIAWTDSMTSCASTDGNLTLILDGIGFLRPRPLPKLADLPRRGAGAGPQNIMADTPENHAPALLSLQELQFRWAVKRFGGGQRTSRGISKESFRKSEHRAHHQH